MVILSVFWFKGLMILVGSLGDLFFMLVWKSFLFIFIKYCNLVV